jgi:OOP family OmpA-OmpF porin
MKKFIIAATAAGLALVASSASAAGSYYLQGNLGYAFSAQHKFSDSDSNVKFKGKGMLGSAALGYKMNNFRTDLELYIDSGFKSKAKEGTKAEFKSFGGFINGYYDFANSTKFTPFIGAGIGALSNQGKTTGDIESKSKRKVHLAYKGVVGVSYEIAKNTSVVAQYQYMHKGTQKLIGGVKFASTSHAAMLGVRFGF